MNLPTNAPPPNSPQFETPNAGRRKFIEALSAAVSSLLAAGCGGGEATAEVSSGGGGGGSTPTPAPPGPAPAPPLPSPAPPPPPPPSPPPPAPPPPAPGTVLTTTTITAGATGTVPFSFGQGFPRGHVAAGAGLQGLQLTVISSWPDGSVRFGIVSGVVSASGGTAQGVALGVGTPAAGAALTLTDLKAQLVQPVRIDAGSFGSASWSGTDWDSPLRTWASGPIMSSWVYRKPIGSDATLVAWLEVRLWNTGAVEVLPWVENGYVMVAGHVNKNTTWTFTLGGTQRESITFNLPARTRAVLITGTKLAHWLGADPGVTVKHDAAYLMGTKLVPSYARPSPDSVVSSWSDSITTPQEAGRFTGIGVAGYSPQIGLLPQWDAMYLTNGSAKVWRIVQQQGYRAGRWGIYYRDENDAHRPARSTLHPYRVFGTTSGVGDSGNSSFGQFASPQTGTVPPTFKTSHHPSMGFMAALLTGRFFHVETTQFVSSINMTHQGDNYNVWSGGVAAFKGFAWIQTRGWGWAIRSLGQAIAITPDGDPMRAEFEEHLRGTALFNHNRYMAGLPTLGNPQGIIAEPGGAGPQGGAMAPAIQSMWMQDFLVASMGYARHLTADSAPAAATFTALFNYLAGGVVGRFGGTGATEFLYRDAAPYNMAFAPSKPTNFVPGSGPWFSNWGQIYAATYINADYDADARVDGSGPFNRVKEIGDGTLRGGAIGNGGSYWANMQPALAYCVEHGVPGAAAAWSRLTSAPNYGTGIQSFFPGAPEWGVYPR